MTRFSRPDWDKYFLSIARQVGTRSNCIKRQLGAIIVRDRRILTTGYNGTPAGIKNCFQGGCKRCSNKNIKSGEKLDECICVHAEENAVIQAALHGIPTKDAILYIEFYPCSYCAKTLINAGIKKIVYSKLYAKATNQISRQLFKEAKITMTKKSITSRLE